MQLPMTYLERKLRGDRTLVIADGRIYEPGLHEQDMTNLLKLGNDAAALIDGPSGDELEDLWETEYKKEISAFIDEEARQITPGKIKGSKLEDEIIRTELKHFIVFKVFRKFVSDQEKLSKALGRLTKEYNEQEKGIQQNIAQHLKGEKSDAEMEKYSIKLSEAVLTKIPGASIGEKLAKKLGQPVQKEQKEEAAEDPAVDVISHEKKDFVFSKSFNFDMLLVDDLVYPLQQYDGRKKTFLKVDDRQFVASEKPMMQIYDLIDIYRANLEKKYKDAAYFSQPRIKKLKEMQALIEEELKRPVYAEKMLEIAETDRPGVMWVIMGFGEFVNKGIDGNYFLFPPGKIAVKVEWNEGRITNGYPANWGEYYAPNITGSGQSLTSLCLAGYDNEDKKMSREEKIADYLSHAVRTMQHGYRPGEVRIYHELRAGDPQFNSMKISKAEMEKRGLRSLNMD